MRSTAEAVDKVEVAGDCVQAEKQTLEGSGNRERPRTGKSGYVVIVIVGGAIPITVTG